MANREATVTSSVASTFGKPEELGHPGVTGPVLRACTWSGIACVLLLLGGFWGVAGFIPPPSPNASAHEIAQMFRDNRTGIRAGMIIAMFGAALMAPWFTALSVHLKRIEGRYSPLAYLQLGLGMILTLEFILPLLCWEAATFRDDRADDLIRLINDVCWITYVALTSTVVLQALVIGAAIVLDKREAPIFPRWAGYYTLFNVFIWCGGSFAVFFKDGLLAWNGLIAWYLPLAEFCLWIAVMTTLMNRATAHLEQELSREAAAVPAP
jgi:hypothetical protein